MTNKVKLFLSTLLLAIMIFPSFIVHAEEVTIHNQSDLKGALAESDVTKIILGNDIETTEKINVTRSVTIDGKGHTIKYVGTFGANNSSDNTVWGGIYVLQFYKTTATLKDIKLTGANAALLINGSKVTLDGKIDVSGNGFGGIELSQGVGVTETVKLILANNANIINTTEKENTPTLWVPEDSDDAYIEHNGIVKTIASGKELTLKEINELFKDPTPSNPKTGDEINLYLISACLGFMSLVVITSLIIKNKNKEF